VSKKQDSKALFEFRISQPHALNLPKNTSFVKQQLENINKLLKYYYYY
jgi:hypothetical protein